MHFVVSPRFGSSRASARLVGGFDFASVTAASLKSDLDATLAKVDEIVGAIPGALATFEHILGALDEAWARTLEADGRTSNLIYVHPDESVRDAAQVALSSLEAWRNGLAFREDLERAVVHYATTPEAAGLAGEGRRLLEIWLRDFRRAGQGLPAGEREAIATLRSRVTELEATFGRNVVDHEDWIEVDRAGLAGLPDDFIDRLTPGSEPGTWRVSLAYAELQAFVALADRRDLREELLRKHWSRAPQNSGLPAEILGLRREIAQRLGYANHAEYVAEVRMAETVPRIRDFLDEYAAGVQPRRDDELEILGDLLEEDGHGRAV
ncbi:MAG TPA: M3 family metallopeptidase, partial [Candidatus Limnocylindrales bacterium]|nr:M3 family metallopeptidase [Candidatus Limnocylindrales bacterium]